MTDRELLELAAKAAGWKGWRSKHGYWNITSPEGEEFSCCHGWNSFDSHSGEELPQPTFADALSEANWNPLTDDGDALRLAVKLGMVLSICNHPDLLEVEASVFPGGRPSSLMFREGYTTDPYAATRRAIVRAAAEIGRAMP